MPEELKKEIQNHLATFPERHEDMLEMKKEWKEYKNRAMWILVGFVGSILSIGIWVGTMQTTIEGITGHETEDKARFLQIESRLNSLEITNSEIRARLMSIEATLQEIKVAVKSIK